MMNVTPSSYSMPMQGLQGRGNGAPPGPPPDLSAAAPQQQSGDVAADEGREIGFDSDDVQGASGAKGPRGGDGPPPGGGPGGGAGGPGGGPGGPGGAQSSPPSGADAASLVASLFSDASETDQSTVNGSDVAQQLYTSMQSLLSAIAA